MSTGQIFLSCAHLYYVLWPKFLLTQLKRFMARLRTVDLIFNITYFYSFSPLFFYKWNLTSTSITIISSNLKNTEKSKSAISKDYPGSYFRLLRIIFPLKGYTSSIGQLRFFDLQNSYIWHKKYLTVRFSRKLEKNNWI